MSRLLIIYDDSQQPEEDIRAIIGNRHFGEIIIEKQTVKERMQAQFLSCFPECTILSLDRADDIASLREQLETEMSRGNGRIRVLHFFSSFLFCQKEEAESVLKCAAFAERVYTAKQNEAVIFFALPSLDEYLVFLHRAQDSCSTSSPFQGEQEDQIRLNGNEFLSISSQEGLILSLTSKYDARFFNNLITEADVVTKRSSNIEKIRAEYQFWHLLPDSMKIWFVMPFDFQEDGAYASYRMERLYVPNLAIKYVHGAMDEVEFDSFLQRYFRFLAARSSRKITKEAYVAQAEKLYVKKTRERLSALKANPQFAPIAALIHSGTPYMDVDAAFERFRAVYTCVVAKCSFDFCEVIGHGDACFSNILYDYASKTLKLIDPKGANTPEELWTNPYYDLCKLSHSVVGLYDFFNSGLYEIALDENLRLQVSVPFHNERHVEILRTHLLANGFDDTMVRAGEAALFLSMLPLHIDNPHKVLAFFLNAMRILDELELTLAGER